MIRIRRQCSVSNPCYAPLGRDVKVLGVRRDLGALTGREYDLLVVGGGIYGAMAAWDAAQRGLKVALVEAADFGSGASWNSLKTIHGGLRDLQRADIRQARESVRERRAFLRIAPALVRPLPFVVPSYGHGRRGREVLALGLRLYERVARDRNDGLPPSEQLPRSRFLSRDEMRALVPGLLPDGLNGGAQWTDAQLTNSERLLLAILHAACADGAIAANRAVAVAFRMSAGRVAGALVDDLERGTHLEVRTRMVLNAAGPGLDAVLRTAGIRTPLVPMVSGLNLVLKRPLVEGHAIGAPSGGRFLFAVPWRDRGIVGTAYGPVEADPGEQAAAFLREAAVAYPWADLTAADVVAVHRGAVPGHAASLASRPVIVDHETAHDIPGLVSIQGVKYTGARSLSERAISLIGARLGRTLPSGRTACTILPGAAPQSGSVEDQTRYAVREEMALHLEDVLLRRLDVGAAGRPDAAIVARVVQVMAAELRWNEPRRRAEEEALARCPAYSTPP
jgi:glycerol-3-phosphate dehydrogenase